MDCGLLTSMSSNCFKGSAGTQSVMSRFAYRKLSRDSGDVNNSEEDWAIGFPRRDIVRIVVGKEKRVFEVEQGVLQEHPFQVLLELTRRGKEMEGVIFVDCESILFEHLLWLMYNDCSSLLKLQLKDIIEFYSQDSL